MMHEIKDLFKEKDLITNKFIEAREEVYKV